MQVMYETLLFKGEPMLYVNHALNSCEKKISKIENVWNFSSLLWILTSRFTIFLVGIRIVVLLKCLIRKLSIVKVNRWGHNAPLLKSSF